MIEKMKIVHIVAAESDRQNMLFLLKKLGILHLKEKGTPDVALSDLFSQLTKTKLALAEYPESSYDEAPLSESKFNKLNSCVIKAFEDKKNLNDQKSSLSMLFDSIKSWGDFNPLEIAQLKEQGIEMHFYRMGKKEFASFSKNDDIRFIKLASVDKMQTVAVIGNALDNSFSTMEFELPDLSLSQMKERLQEIDSELNKAEDVIKNASKYLSSYDKYITKVKNSVSFSCADSTVTSEDGLVWICGYIPADVQVLFEKTASKNGWAYAVEDPDEDDEHVPTKVRYTKLTRLMKPVFDILGTVPGYHEYDISFWFLCFFALFFAMIVGDGGYGLVFLACAIGLHIKNKKTNDAVLLLYVLSVANIAWGAVTGTWFGLEGAMNIGLLRSLVIPSIANYPQYFGVEGITAQNNVMQFCFIIGTVQLSLACIMNIRTKLKSKNLSWVADLGWLCSINALYYVVLLLVIGKEIDVKPAFACVITGFVLVVLFGGMSPDKTFGQGLKSGLADAFTTFLNTISAFGNVMSYIRLFAVGMASLAIAQSFNNMAGGFSGILKIVGIVVFIIGHVLNLVMALLSVVVHGVRLNLLEFSGQLGMEWSGVAYEPFSEIKK